MSRDLGWEVDERFLAEEGEEKEGKSMSRHFSKNITMKNNGCERVNVGGKNTQKGSNRDEICIDRIRRSVWDQKQGRVKGDNDINQGKKQHTRYQDETSNEKNYSC
ncbi:uncharacterized protein T551_03312 [Pneumocystis jirovecii RU7]|uniref:Uncharacterized protein n=1 Tax=Pneumocystis jirovecii (strain RU7) TaxID=1408657 RepID=A0A0W4ZES5_PNEJ7|nr:uncharacterized protein T551_03312 [Pneumocystis jirovecii RU7]KTW26850.1 hypothetical protein T551_03312 [Pneumocystis jirovecii RU7]